MESIFGNIEANWGENGL